MKTIEEDLEIHSHLMTNLLLVSFLSFWHNGCSLAVFLYQTNKQTNAQPKKNKKTTTFKQENKPFIIPFLWKQNDSRPKSKGFSEMFLQLCKSQIKVYSDTSNICEITVIALTKKKTKFY